MNTHLIPISYPLDEKKFIEAYSQYASKAEAYSDPRIETPVEHWKILRFDPTRVQNILNDLNVEGSTSIYLLEKNKSLKPHKDYETQCSLNFILGDDEPAPVIIEGREYFYKQCLLNTQRLHWVKNGNRDRLLFKISIFDMSFEEVAQRIPLCFRAQQI